MIVFAVALSETGAEVRADLADHLAQEFVVIAREDVPPVLRHEDHMNEQAETTVPATVL
ncbi:hypothetical protein GCM10027200_40550 [Lentzea nigeriaca]